MSDLDKNILIIKKLQDYGFDIEIDDFGSGYSSLNMLKDISADVLKIDMAFYVPQRMKSRARIYLKV